MEKQKRELDENTPGFNVEGTDREFPILIPGSSYIITNLGDDLFLGGDKASISSAMGLLIIRF